MLSRRLSRSRFAVLLAVTLLGPTLGWTAPASAGVTTGLSSSSGSSTSRTSITLARPAGTGAGQVMLASIVSNDDQPNFTAPAGWTEVRNDSIVDVIRQAVYVKVAGSSEPSSYTWSLAEYRRVAGGITTYSGVDTGNPVHAHGGSINSVSSTTVAIPSITTSVPDTRLVALTAVNAEGTLSPPTGMAEQWEAAAPTSTTTRDALASASDSPQAATGSTAPRTATATQPGRSIGALIALTPAAAAGPDTTAPQTTITSGPSGDVSDTSATFTFAANEPATFECKLDTAAFAACTSPKTYTPLAVGTHTFTVRATDLAGNAEDSAETRTWTIVSAPDPVLVGAGDIAGCGGSGDEATANLLDGIAGTVFTSGDNVYNDGTAAQFNTCYGPSWGRHKARTRPAAGNHEYLTAGASGYFGYFGAAAGDPSKGYYDYRLGAWHVIVLNSECAQVGGCGAGSAQEQWLRRVLEASAADCTVAIWHHPRFSSAQSTGSRPVYQPFWQALYDHGADVVLTGHDHFYERFGLQSPTGVADAVHGIRQFTVGTGGKSFHAFGTPLPNSEVRNGDTFGVLKLTLHSNSYDWQFVPQAGKTFTDSGTAACHGRPNLPPPPPPPGPDTTPPETTITSGPSGTTTDTSATFAFTANEPSTFTCQLDSGPATACTSPVTYTGLPVATHTFTVTATDTSPNHNTDPDPAVRTWTIATGPPPAPQGVIQTAAGTVRGFGGDGGLASGARLAGPRTMATDAVGNMFVVDTDNHRVRRIDAATGVITTIAGTGVAGFSGDGGPATSAQVNTPNGITVGGNGAVYVADSPNHRIRRIANGVITTVAGTGTSGYNGDNIAGTAARLNYPKGVELGPDGHLYIADATNHRVRRLDLTTGVITTVAGSGTAGYSGDGGPAKSARLRAPRNTAFGAGGLYIADDENLVVRRVHLSTGVITTVAGTGIAGFSGDGGPATSAQLRLVRDVAVDPAGNLYIADEQNHRIRVVTPDGIITTMAGTGVAGFSGDGGPAHQAQIRGPRGVAIDGSGRILIGDTGNNRLRRVARP